MTTVAAEELQSGITDQYVPITSSAQISIALLGLGQVGAALVTTALTARQSSAPIRIIGALVRDAARIRIGRHVAGVAVTTKADTLLDSAPDVVVEALGGLEPARTLVLDALRRGIPVVTANKSLLAAHGEELFAAAAQGGAALRYEAAVVAGVPFLGTFSRRPFASAIGKLIGVVNGTTNFVLSRLGGDGISFADALCAAQHCGFAEPDPSRDILGLDSSDKLCVLLRHFGRWSVRPEDIETSGIANVAAEDLRCAAAFGGTIKPVVFADWRSGHVLAFAGPAFLPAGHQLAAVAGPQNGIVLSGGPSGDLFYAGAGAGPWATAATILDDVVEAVADAREGRSGAIHHASSAAVPEAPETAWFVRIRGPRLPPAPDVADLLGTYGVWQRHGSDVSLSAGVPTRWLLTYPCPRTRLDQSLRALSAAADCTTVAIRALED